MKQKSRVKFFKGWTTALFIIAIVCAVLSAFTVLGMNIGKSKLVKTEAEITKMSPSYRHSSENEVEIRYQVENKTYERSIEEWGIHWKEGDTIEIYFIPNSPLQVFPGVLVDVGFVLIPIPVIALTVIFTIFALAFLYLLRKEQRREQGEF